MGAVSHLLKILNGPHTGAQSGFGEGDSLTIGSSPEDDIILSDPHILPRHCRISLASGECSVTPLEGDVLVSGRAVASTHILTPERVVTLGSTSLVVGPKEGGWPPVTIPDLKTVGALSPNGSTALPDVSPERDSSSRVLKIILPALLLIALILFAASFFSADSVKTPRNPEYPGTVQKNVREHAELKAGEALDALEKLMTKELPEVTVIRNTSKQHDELIVMAPDEEKTLAARRVAAEDPRRALFVQVINREEVNRVLTQLIQSKAPTLSASVTKTGDLDWSGYLRTKEEFPPVRDAVRQDLHFLQKDQDRIVYGEPLAKQIASEIEKRGVGPGIMVKAGEKGLTVSGGVPPGQYALWKKTFDAVVAAHPGVTIENQIDSAVEGKQLDRILGSPVAGITFGKSAWIELSNGTRLFPGSILPNGMTLLSISPSDIRFQTPSGILMIPVSSVDSQPPAR